MALRGVWILNQQLLDRKADLHQCDREPWREKKEVAKQIALDQQYHEIDWYQNSMIYHIPNELVSLKQL